MKVMFPAPFAGAIHVNWREFHSVLLYLEFL